MNTTTNSTIKVAILANTLFTMSGQTLIEHAFETTEDALIFVVRNNEKRAAALAKNKRLAYEASLGGMFEQQEFETRYPQAIELVSFATKLETKHKLIAEARRVGAFIKFKEREFAPELYDSLYTFMMEKHSAKTATAPRGKRAKKA